MKNKITINADNISIHKISYILGILIGMKIPYEINPKCPLYVTMREHKKKRWQELQEARRTIPYNDEGYRVLLSGGNEEDFTVHVKHPSKEDLYEIKSREFGGNPVK